MSLFYIKNFDEFMAISLLVDITLVITKLIIKRNGAATKYEK